MKIDQHFARVVIVFAMAFTLLMAKETLAGKEDLEAGFFPLGGVYFQSPLRESIDVGLAYGFPLSKGVALGPTAEYEIGRGGHMGKAGCMLVGFGGGYIGARISAIYMRTHADPRSLESRKTYYGTELQTGVTLWNVRFGTYKATTGGEWVQMVSWGIGF